jgi:hypothetical protein
LDQGLQEQLKRLSTPDKGGAVFLLHGIQTIQTNQTAHTTTRGSKSLNYVPVGTCFAVSPEYLITARHNLYDKSQVINAGDHILKNLMLLPVLPLQNQFVQLLPNSNFIMLKLLLLLRARLQGILKLIGSSLDEQIGHVFEILLHHLLPRTIKIIINRRRTLESTTIRLAD